MDHKDKKSDRHAGDARVVKSRSALQAGLIALLEERDFAALTVQQVAAQAGVGYATFFRHFPSLDALLIDVAETLTADFIAEAMPALMAGERAAMLAALADFVDARRGAVRALLTGGGAVVRREITARAITRTAGLPLGFDPAVPPDLAIRHAVTSAMAAVEWWVSQPPPADRDALIRLIERLALGPVIARP